MVSKTPLDSGRILLGSRELIDQQPASKFGLYRELVASNVPITPGWNRPTALHRFLKPHYCTPFSFSEVQHVKVKW